MGKVFGTVLVSSGKQSSFLPQKFGFDEFDVLDVLSCTVAGT